MEEFEIAPVMDFIQQYRRNFKEHVQRISSNRYQYISQNQFRTRHFRRCWKRYN